MINTAEGSWPETVTRDVLRYDTRNGRTFQIDAPEADVTAPASGKTALSFFLEEDPYCEGLAIRSRRGRKISDCLLTVVDQNEDFGPDITRKRVVIGAVTLFLQDDKRIGKRDDTAREAAALQEFFATPCSRVL